MSRSCVAGCFGYSDSNISNILQNILTKTKDWVNKHIGVSAFTRDHIIQNTPQFIKTLYPNNDIITTMDGTYFRCQKSENFNIQRRTYSSHKKYNLIKEMPIMMMNGTWLETFGPFFSDGNKQ